LRSGFCLAFLEAAPLEITMPVSQSLRPQEVIVIKTTPTRISSPESIVPIEVSIANSIYATMPDDRVADDGPASDSRTATIPTAVTRVVTVDKYARFFIQPATSATSLRQACGRQCDQQNKARHYQQNLAIEFL